MALTCCNCYNPPLLGLCQIGSLKPIIDNKDITLVLILTDNIP